MAQRQTRLSEMSPQEQKKQNDWVEGRLQGMCPGRVRWDRVQDGYVCVSKIHKVTV